ncbi:nucleotide-diphospho-sugar transferase [Mucilaginibacter myungsuensis]|uniref:Nucleotide-diphospho-sugar transferase n=1 Tax=Mucilaginibacter myungsuensis TaxID=649104 RepID=A0A929KY03_9SPHI|nr:nucleotide-diphospho-sugar transferase [Mucilaginibacter myungsuensis]MBE9663746.1 nucleotide-diphospho-sugar transferase [Mucilaginibacter myungsuensis]MDN3598931.1 nucleotide-diphospho-sugar transferase [Mucilaginibacter myungsuensis]
MKEPVLLLTFNRLDTLAATIQAIRGYRPEKLFVASDGPRRNKAGEAKLINDIRAYILEQIDWKCEVHTLFRNDNYGCGKGVSGAITWFFENVERGIILEDDCVANESFFKFCEDLLEKYDDDERVMHISGNNFQLSEVSEHSYYFSYACQIWGWATWRRAWLKYDFSLKEYTSSWDYNGFLTDKFERKYWDKQFKKVQKGRIDTWDYQWIFTCWKNNGLTVMPKFNLVKNTGFSSNGTHTNSSHFIENLKTYPLTITSHPAEFERNLKADRWHAEILSFRDMGPVSRLIRFFDGLKTKFRGSDK